MLLPSPNKSEDKLVANLGNFSLTNKFSIVESGGVEIQVLTASLNNMAVKSIRAGKEQPILHDVTLGLVIEVADNDQLPSQKVCVIFAVRVM